MKYLFFFSLNIFLFTHAFSQDYKFEAGIQGGPNLSYFSYKNSFIQNARKPTDIQFSAGLFLQYNLSENFSLRIDPTFDRKGYQYKDVTFTDNSGNMLGTGKLYGHLDYITIPVLFKASVGNKVKYFVNAGPSIGLLLSETFIYDNPYGNGNQKTHNTNQYKKADAGITAGLGIAIPLGNAVALSFEVRNNVGLTNINKNSNANSAIHANTTSMLVGVAYKFGSN
jgi:hypothetical protein